MSVSRATDFADLVFHALAFVPIRGPARIHDERYVRWARATLEPTAWEVLVEDAPAIVALHERDPRAVRVQVLPMVHRSIEGFLASARRELPELGDDDVDDPQALALLRSASAPLVDLLRADLALIARAYATARQTWTAAAQHACDEVRALLGGARLADPDLAGAPIELAWALGTHGRALGPTLIAGSPAPWNDTTAATAMVIALHEHAVRRVSRTLSPDLEDHERWAQSEWAAISDLAARIDRAPPELRAAHGAWLAALDLRELEEAALRRS